MVGFDPHSQFELSSFEYGAAGVLSGIVTRFFCQPLDVIKIRFQLQVDPIRNTQGSKYHGIIQATRLIIREEGFKALWKGHIPAQGLSVVYGLVQFGSFEIFTKWSWNYLPQRMSTDLQPITDFACGSVAGIFAVTCGLPLDVLRTRLVAQGEPKFYRGVCDAAKKMWSHEGFLSFYRGFIPTIIQTAPYTGFQFTFYLGAVHLWNSLIGYANENDTSRTGALESLVCGSIAGTGAKMAVYPLDMLKKRLQVIGFENARQPFGTVHSYRGLIHCIKVILKHEGIAGMYKGLVPSIIKAAPYGGLGFMTYEQTCKYLRTWHHLPICQNS